MLDNVIRCHCETRTGSRMIVAVQKADGSVEKRRDGKSVRFEGPGRAHLSCEHCGFKTELTLDSPMVASVAL